MRKFLILILCLMSISVHSQQWEIAYSMEEGAFVRGGCCNGDGNYVFGVCDLLDNDVYSNAYAMYIGNDGSYITRKFVYEGYKSELCSAVCLDNGNAFVVGIKGGTLSNHVYDSLWIAVVNPELEVVAEHCYPFIAPYKTWTSDVYLDFDSEGHVIVLADVSEKDYPLVTNGVYVVLKCDVDGNVLQTQYFSDGHGTGGARPTGIIRVPDVDRMMLLGKAFMSNGAHSIAYIDNELNFIDAYPIPWMESTWNDSDYWKDSNHFLMSSQTYHYNVYDSYYAAVFEVDDEGHYVDTLVYDRADTADYTAQFGSMAFFNDETIYITTYWENGVNVSPNDVVVLLIDKDLNLLGVKKLMFENVKIRPLHCQVTSDGGCLVYGKSKKTDGTDMIIVWKLLPEDFIIPWTLTDLPVVLQHPEVYPNPTSDCLNFVLENNDNQNVRICIWSEDGLKYFERRFDNIDGLLTIDVSTLGCGTYLYDVMKGGKNIMKGRFVKN